MKYVRLSVLTVVLSLTGWLWYARRRSTSALAVHELPMQAQDIHNRLMQLPMYTWYYKRGASRHLGAMAQDWKAAFPMLGGKQSTIISIIDALGVLMAAVQWQGHLIEVQEQRIQQIHHQRLNKWKCMWEIVRPSDAFLIWRSRKDKKR